MVNKHAYHIMHVILYHIKWHGIIIHCLGLGHETMVCAVCLSFFTHGNVMIQIKS